MDAAGIFATDVRGIDWADALVAIMDGSDPDSGTAWECGYAYGKKPIVLVRTDLRSHAEWRRFLQRDADPVRDDPAGAAARADGPRRRRGPRCPPTLGEVVAMSRNRSRL